MSEYNASARQIVNPGESIVFTYTVEPCNRGFVRHRDETGNFLLKGWLPRQRGCCCCRRTSAQYLAKFKADVAVPEGETVGPITVAMAVDAATVPASTMTSTPPAVEEFNNIASAITIPVWVGCCETVTVRNTSPIPIAVQNANIILTRPDLQMSY